MTSNSLFPEKIPDSAEPGAQGELPEASPSIPLTYPVSPECIPTEPLEAGRYELSFARRPEELREILRLRFEVFNLEMGEGLEESFETGLDEDEFDAFCHHLLVRDRDSGVVVGTYRMQTSTMARRGNGFYSAGEYDLSGLPEEVAADSIELGRACVALQHRNTQVLFLLWKGLAQYVTHNQTRFLFGCCSLTSQDPREGHGVLRLLEAKGQMHPDFRVLPQKGYECYYKESAEDPELKVKLPKLFRIYLRHGAKVCSPPAIDRQFKTIDFLVVFDVAAMDERQIRTFFG